MMNHIKKTLEPKWEKGKIFELICTKVGDGWVSISDSDCFIVRESDKIAEKKIETMGEKLGIGKN